MGFIMRESEILSNPADFDHVTRSNRRGSLGMFELRFKPMSCVPFKAPGRVLHNGVKGSRLM
jgi:hypothetical protein